MVTMSVHTNRRGGQTENIRTLLTVSGGKMALKSGPNCQCYI